MSGIPTLEYDEEANAFKLRFTSAEIDDTIVLSDSVSVDVDAQGGPVGVEILNATSRELPSIGLPGKVVALRDLHQSIAA